MAVGEQVTESSKPIKDTICRTRVWVIGNSLVGSPKWICAVRYAFKLRIGRKVGSSPLTLDDNSHEPGVQASSHSLSLDVIANDRRARHQALELRSARDLCAVLRRLRIRRLSQFHREPVADILDHRLDIGLLARLGARA